MHYLQPLDTDLLNVLQTQVPLVERPFLHLAKEFGTTELEVITRLKKLRHPEPPERPIIRQISAIFDSKSLGYETTLVAAQVEESKLVAAAAIINEHPGVSHNYRRNHAFNLWYTLAVPPDSMLGLEKTLEILHQRSGAVSTRMLPTEKLFKIGVKFDLSGEADVAARTDPSAPHFVRGTFENPVTDEDKRAIRILQQDLPLCPEPFKIWAGQAGMTVGAFLECAQSLITRKLMRRFAAVLKHREAGISANAMGIWIVPPEKCESFGQFAASFAAVSHCYLRKTYPDWPYSIFTMVHAATKEQCESVLKRISIESGVREYSALYSSTEYKKTRVQYFTPEIPAWEAAAG
ncbi:MAG TPA: Lrp/AsnC family transcriptional regulator [Phycisphaerae bacterium]|nr:Lrp/AsnC family transcriptional regulator [Phycisphaerae bacterium]